MTTAGTKGVLADGMTAGTIHGEQAEILRGQPCLNDKLNGFWRQLPYESLFRRSPALAAMAIGALVLSIGTLDYLLGEKISISLIYLWPITFATRALSTRAGALTAVACSAVWLIGDLAFTGDYLHPLIPCWNALVRLGVFLIVVRLLSYFLQDQARLVQAVTQSTTELRKEIDERKGTEHAILEMLDEQRRQIAYELHDGLAQALTGMAFKAKLLHEDLQTIAPEHAATMGDMERHLNEAVGQTRNLARGLDPVEVEANELIAALRKLAADTESTFRICCDLKSNAQKLAVEPEIGRHLYRIAQQAIDNAIRHGAARRISMELHKTGRDLSVIIKDDGIGFEAGAQPNVGLGLRIMRFRSDLVGGRVKISSTPGAGTCVECIVPNLPLTPGKERLPR